MPISPPRALYVHLPFCERKCHYCDFVSVAGRRQEADYMTAVEREVRDAGHALPGTRLDTIFFGGGTPGYVDPARLASLLAVAHDAFTVSPTAEVTLEANPSSTSVERARTWRSAGFNRVSLGIQSLDDGVLHFLGRVHDSERALRAVAEVRQGGFDSINCDLIYAVPGLGDSQWRSAVTKIAETGVEHVSCYELTVEPQTPLHRLVAQGRVRPIDADAALRQHWIAATILGQRGYTQYEVSNFARPGGACRHNLVYWRGATYLACGVGAHGHVDAASARQLGLSVNPGDVALRYWHSRAIGDYLHAMTHETSPVAGTEGVTAAQRRDEEIMLGLRLAEGIRAELVSPSESAVLVAEGMLVMRSGRLCATPRGQEVLNAVALRLAESAIPV